MPSIGQPVANTRIYLLDEQRRPVPVGVAGEIYIGGACVARGYLNRDELTAERFIADPFATAQGARLYKTGDLGCWQADGHIDYLGRNDDQIKIRGFRIELGEIEARLGQYPGLRDTAVLAREDRPGEKRLVAYFSLQDGQALPEADDLRVHLQALLPDYMIPAWIAERCRNRRPMPSSAVITRPRSVPPKPAWPSCGVKCWVSKGSGASAAQHPRTTTGADLE